MPLMEGSWQRGVETRRAVGQCRGDAGCGRRRLLDAQFPQWADLPLAPVPSAGTDNAIYRLGDDLAVRLPRIHWATGQVVKERAWLPRLAPFLPLQLPVQLAVGEPAAGYPYQWAVYRWLPGEHATSAPLADPKQAARDLAAFILALQQIDTAGGPLASEHNLRGVPLALRDAATRAAITTVARRPLAAGRAVEADDQLTHKLTHLRSPRASSDRTARLDHRYQAPRGDRRW